MNKNDVEQERVENWEIENSWLPTEI